MTEVDEGAIEAFRKDARIWLEANAELRPRVATAWGEGSDSVAIFLNLTEDEERALVADAQAWQAKKFDAGWGAISWPEEFGGRGLPPAFAAAFNDEESAFDTPRSTEVFGVTMGLIAPTIAVYGTPAQKERFIKPLLRTDILACQLFSEPGAGSDLASLSTKAERDGDEWVITGQKVWTSGAHVAAWGECICRTDPDVVKHQGQTAFMVPLDADGVEIRPIRQMSGGAAFNEVFLNDVRVSDDLRLGEVGQGWSVALTTLANERGFSGSGGSMGGGFDRLLGLVRFLGKQDDPLVRQELARLYTKAKARQFTGQRVSSKLRSGQTPGPEGSIGKLAWTEGLTETSNFVAWVLGPRITADTGEWGTFAWTEHLLGAPGFRIAGGSDEVQRNIIGERVLGLPKEPRPETKLTFREEQRAVGAR